MGTEYHKAHSLATHDDGEAFRLSIVTSKGKHLLIEIGPHQIVLLNEEFAKKSADNFRKTSCA